MIEVAGAVALGVALGVATGLPIGLVNVAIVEAATAGRRDFATRIGLGGAVADAVHAGAAFVGIARVITERPGWQLAMALVTAAAVVMYATTVWRRRRAGDAPEVRAPRHGILVGLALTLPNPGALAAWLVVAAVVWPGIPLADALAVAAGVGAGSALWFSALARWFSRQRRGTDARDR